MHEKIGQIIKQIATSKGLSQKQFGDKINRTKQAVAGIYKRSTIDIELLKVISEKLEHDFLEYYYEEEPFKTFRNLKEKEWEQKISVLENELISKDKLIDKNEEILLLQRKYIAELEEKLSKRNT
ncbi:helix-turn-helix domain-containing protein [Sphingobacterium daejeonense]|uniref:helix-turn-helix domain-containing protein n=1 Tax=Sphingobacterium daejeonense TaxID=371142 RepID=UPI0021A26F3E|nr:helix-turn-helix transcriptional regulator [Sphingobacterium daejeonense]MCT1533015.1 helix-turn-helix domain-containing protein [Sphingobacterium daejeonense]